MKTDLIQFADTLRQIEILEAVTKHGSQVKAAQALNLTADAVHGVIKRLKQRAAQRGLSPQHDMTHLVPDGYQVKGVSTLYDQDGKPKIQWVKSSIDAQRQAQMLREFAGTLGETVKGLGPITLPPKHGSDDLLCVIPMGDPHFGMHAWAQESGDDFDLKIAEQITCDTIDRLIAAAPNATTAILLNLGDMFHADNQNNTSKSGHQLDVDGRQSKVKQVALRAKVHCIRRMLEKFGKVVVKINRGNHDDESAYALSMMLDCWFHNEPRVTIDLSPSMFWYYEFGANLIGSTHGDKVKGPDLPSIMAADQPEAWGRTKHRVWFVGHVHHKDIKEYRGGLVEYVRTTAAKDAWHAGQGYRSGRDMQLIVHHKEYGEVERHRCDVAMLS